MMTHGMAVIRPAASSTPGEAQSKVTQVVLDDIDYYFATNAGVAFSPDGRRALVTSSDADIVSILDTARLGAATAASSRGRACQSPRFRRHLCGQAPAHGPQSHLRGRLARQPLGLRRQSPGRFRNRRGLWRMATRRIRPSIWAGPRKSR